MKRVLYAVVAAATLGAVMLAPGGASAQGAPDGTSLLHGIPDTPVDVYIAGTATFPNFQPGAIEDLTASAGTTLTNIEVFAAGADPASDTPLLTAASLAIPPSGNNSVVVHLNAAGAPTISAYVNNSSETGTGLGRITVRHAAAAPAVDLVLSNGDRPLLDLSNGRSQEFEPAPGSYDIQLAEAGGDLLAGTATQVESVVGSNLIVYAVGSMTAGIEYFSQTLTVGGDAGTTTTEATTTTAAATTTTDPAADTTTTTTTAAATTTTTTAAVPVAVNTGSPLDSPLSLSLVTIALGAFVVTGAAITARRRV